MSAKLNEILDRKEFAQSWVSINVNEKQSNDLPVQMKWLVEPKNLKVQAGKPAQVECQADGLPQPRVEWFKSSGDNKLDYLGPRLQFHSIAPSDAGYFECHAKNGVEQDLKSRIKLEVLGK